MKPESDARHFLSICAAIPIDYRTSPVEAIEDLRQVFGVYPAPVVLNFDSDVATVRVCVDANAST